MCDNQNGFAEKLRWGKNLNLRDGLSVGQSFQLNLTLLFYMDMSLLFEMATR